MCRCGGRKAQQPLWRGDNSAATVATAIFDIIDDDDDDEKGVHLNADAIVFDAYF